MVPRRARADRRLALGLLYTCFASLTLTAQAPPRPPIAKLVAELQEKYDTVRSFSADFEHTYTGGVLRTALVERGTVQIKKPGKMRWSYTEPEEKLFVSDGASLYSYVPFDQQVIVGTVPSDDNASTAVLFLAGQGRLTDDFTAAFDEARTTPSTWAIELTPVRSTADYTRLVLVVDRETLSLRALTAWDFQDAASTFVFDDLQENPGLPDSLFTFEVPDGVEVVDEDSFRR